jgi:predicted RNase H-related nuclease YkuK (DUF458 family)
MENLFRKLSNGEVVADYIQYVKDYLKENPNTEIWVGTDSQNIGMFTKYALVIVMHKNKKGGHVIYSKMKYDRIKDRFARLWKEVELSANLANDLRNNNIDVKFVDLDLNPDPQYKSNFVIRAAVGYLEGSGFKTRVKPLACTASYVADKLCKY